MKLSAVSLRSTNIQLSGSGLGAWTSEKVGKLFTDILPEMFALAAKGKLIVETVSHLLENIADLRKLNIDGGERLVITI